MASQFVVNTRIPSVQGQQVIQPTAPTATPQQNIFIYGNRRNPTASETNGLPILVPDSGFPRYEYYKTYKLPSQFLNDSLGMLSYFDSCGFSVGYGYSSSVNLLNAAHVDIITLAAEDQVIVYYLSSQSLVAPLLGSGVSGTFNDSDASVTGTFVSAEIGSFVVSSVTYDSKVILQSNSFASVAAGDDISISFTDSSILTPDPSQTEPFLMNLYQAISAALIPLNVNSTVATPNVYFAFLPNSALSGYFGPISATQALSVNTAHTATTLTFTIPSNNVDLIPLSSLGATTISQVTSGAVGTIVSSSITDAGLVVTLSNVTGTFDNTHLCSIHLDATKTIFSFQQTLFASLNISLSQIPLIYPVLSNTDITTTYAPIFSYVAALNLPQTSQDGQSICQVVIGNLTIPQNLAVSTLASAVNNYQIEPVYYPYVPVVGELPLTVGQLTSAYCMVVGSNVPPLNPQGGVVISGLPVKVDNNSYVSTQINGIAGQVMQIGWNVIAVNNNLQACVINPITGQLTLPNTSVPDVEFYPEYVWQTADIVRKDVTLICKAIGLGQVRQTQKTLATLKSNIVSAMLNRETQGMIKNVIANQAFILIKQDPDNPLGVDISIPLQIIPGLEQIFYTINIFSSTVSLQTTA